MKIYPKTNEYLEGIEEFEKTLKEYKGIEIQYFKKSDKELVDFKIEKPIEQILERYPYIEEITIHPPLCNYELEIVLLKDKNIFLKQIKEIVKMGYVNNEARLEYDGKQWKHSGDAIDTAFLALGLKETFNKIRLSLFMLKY